MEFYNPNVPKSIFSWPKSGPPLGHEISWDIWVMTFLRGPPLGAEKPFINEIAVHFSWLLKRAPPSGTFGLWAPLGARFLFFGLTRGRMIFTKKRFKYKSQCLMRTHQSKFGCPGYSTTEFARVKLRGPAFGLLTLDKNAFMPIEARRYSYDLYKRLSARLCNTHARVPCHYNTPMTWVPWLGIPPDTYC